MNENYFITNTIAQELYDDVSTLPIIDYHCHLSPIEILEDRPFENVGRAWLEHDHYKWRLMRASGVDERLITGNASWRDKFIAYCNTIQGAVGNPLYHWTKMELQTYFGIYDGTPEEIWECANQVLQEQALSPRKILAQSKVHYVGTTDDPADSLDIHKALCADSTLQTAVIPSFRTDRILLLRQAGYSAYIKKLGEAAKIEISDLTTLCQAICTRLDDFCALGCRFSDVGIPYFPHTLGTKDQAQKAFAAALSGAPISEMLFHEFLGFLYRFLATEYHKRDLMMQWHLTVYRNPNETLYHRCGADCGTDCMGDPLPGEHLIALLNAMERDGLPKTILYTLNPANVTQLMTIAGSFSRVTCGTAWWFNDHKRGISQQLEAFAETGNLSTFLGMTTDSRSFFSYVRHDYFRRILCNLLGDWVKSGECSMKTAHSVAHAVCYRNAKKIVLAQ